MIVQSTGRLRISVQPIFRDRESREREMRTHQLQAVSSVAAENHGRGTDGLATEIRKKAGPWMATKIRAGWPS